MGHLTNLYSRLGGKGENVYAAHGSVWIFSGITQEKSSSKCWNKTINHNYYTLYSLSAFWLAKSPLLISRIHMILWTSMIIVIICSPIMRRLYCTQCECVIHLWLKNMSTWMVSSGAAAWCICPCSFRSTNKIYLPFTQVSIFCMKQCIIKQ